MSETSDAIATLERSLKFSKGMYDVLAGKFDLLVKENIRLREEVSDAKSETDTWYGRAEAYKADLATARDQLQQMRAALKTHAPYQEWCRDPLLCHDKGACPRDPTCGDCG